MKELEKLARAIVSVVPKDEFGDRFLCLDHKFKDSDLSGLPGSLRVEIEALTAEIRKRVPDDVQWTLIFDAKGTRFGIEYDDGTTGTVNGGQYYGKGSKLLADIEGIDWNEFRGESLQAMGVFEALLDEAKDRPVNIPSSAEAARKWAEQLAKAVVEVRSRVPRPSFAAIFVRDDEGVSIVTYETRDKLTFDMCNALPTSYQVLAIWENGKELGFPEIEALKREVIAELGPISRAKAEGRFFP